MLCINTELSSEKPKDIQPPYDIIPQMEVPYEPPDLETKKPNSPTLSASTAIPRYFIFEIESDGVPGSVKDADGKYVYAPFRSIRHYDCARMLRLHMCLVYDRPVKYRYAGFCARYGRAGHDSDACEYQCATPTELFTFLRKYIDACTHIAAHDIAFNYNILRHEVYRVGNLPLLASIEKKIKICTQVDTATWCRILIPFKFFKFKMPQLSQVFERCFKQKAPDAPTIDHRLRMLLEIVIHLDSVGYFTKRFYLTHKRADFI